ncbi:hypothetical protein [Shouchella miscanthi]|uniref:hypothetical protein n=1 Tax=Shouchella miscanthi TaxID=2598861 RepID=UPI00119FD003|nr:hypothetical protein [Shouchella miscanthi]
MQMKRDSKKEGIIVKRKNRSIVIVNINGENMNCFLQTPSIIDNLELENLPCLLSYNTDDCVSDLLYKIDAISIDKETWIGLNQSIVTNR